MRFSDRVAEVLPELGTLEAEQRLSELFASASARDIASLETLRSLGSEYGRFEHWYSLEKTGVARLAKGPASCAVLTVHRDGHVRQAAIERLATTEATYALCFLLLRRNDWAAPVRSAAQKVMQPWVTPSRASALIHALPILEALRGQKRADHAAFVASIITTLQAPAARTALLAATRSNDRHTRRACFTFALQAAPTDLDLIHRALHDDNVVVRAQALSCLEGLAPTARRQLALVALSDVAASLRTRAVRLLTREDEASVLPLLCDKTGGVRGAARVFFAANDPSFDAAAHYRRTLASKPRGAIFGLAECGSEDDVLLLDDFRSDPRGSVRAAALSAIAQLDPTTAAAFVDSLTDSNRKVAQLAASILATRIRGGIARDVLAVVEHPDARRHTIEIGCALLIRRGYAQLLRASLVPHIALRGFTLSRLAPKDRDLAEWQTLLDAVIATRDPRQDEIVARTTERIAHWRAWRRQYPDF